MAELIELSPFILAGIGLLSLVVATITRIVSEKKRQSVAFKIFTALGFIALLAAAGIAAWTVLSSF